MYPTAQENHNGITSVKDAAQSTGYSTSYISRLCRTDKILCEQKNKEWIIDTQSLEEFVSSQERRKQGYAATLARSRKDAYRYAQIEKRSISVSSGGDYARTITPQSMWHKVAFAGVSLMIVFSSSSLALFGWGSSFVRVGNSTLQESLQGFGEIVADATNAVSQQMDAAAAIGAESRRVSAHAVRVQTLPLNISMQDIPMASSIVLPVTAAYVQPQSTAFIAQFFLKTLPTYALEQQLAAINVTHVSRKTVFHELTRDYIDSGQFLYSLIERGLGGYHTALTQSGVTTLAFGASIRDVLIKTPSVVWYWVGNATQSSIHSYVALVYIFVDGTSYTLYEGNKSVLTLGTVIFNNVSSTASAASALIP